MNVNDRQLRHSYTRNKYSIIDEQRYIRLFGLHMITNWQQLIIITVHSALFILSNAQMSATDKFK